MTLIPARPATSSPSASDSVTGCPVNFNFLIGDEFVKLSSGHAANLAAESFAALTGTPPVCNAAAATLNYRWLELQPGAARAGGG